MRSDNRYTADRGPEPFAVSIEEAVCRNRNYRTALWTGRYLQLTMMCIPAGGEIGLEVHPDTDQFIYIEQGNALVKMGECKNEMKFAFPVPLAHTSRFPLLYITIRRGC